MRSVGCPESDLLLHASRESLPRPVLANVAALSRQVTRPPRLLQLARSHKTYPLLLNCLELDAFVSEGRTLDPLLRKLRRDLDAYRSNLVPRLLSVLFIVRRLLGTEHVPFSILKGLPFAEEFYRDVESRISVDVDVLVPEPYRDKALARLAYAGFQSTESAGIQQAKRDYSGKAELLHPTYRITLDVNWLLVGNAGIGKVTRDDAVVWERARRISEYEYRLGIEDTLLFHIRHVGHGHDFEHALIQCCVDVAAILRTCEGKVEWDYVIEQARLCECLRVLRLFAYFFDEYYRDETMPVLSDEVPALRPHASDRECRLFSKFVLAPLVRRKLKGKTTDQFINGNLVFAGKLWALDRMRRLIKIFFTGLWPSRHEVAMLTEGSRFNSPALLRIRYYLNPLLPGLPGGLAGLGARLFVELIRHIGAARRRFAFALGTRKGGASHDSDRVV